jgi:DNA-binding response OmpR family regulator
MRVIVTTADPVLVSYIATLLTDDGITFHIADRHLSGIEASHAAFPMRVMVLDADCGVALRILREAGLEASLTS